MDRSINKCSRLMGQHFRNGRWAKWRDPGGISNNRNSVASQGSLKKKKNLIQRSVEKYITVMVRFFSENYMNKKCQVLYFVYTHVRTQITNEMRTW